MLSAGAELGKKVFGSLSSKIASSDTVRVESSGLRLGWTVATMLAAIGLGLYISSIVNPLDHRIQRLEEIKIEQGKAVEMLAIRVEKVDNDHKRLIERLHDEQDRVKAQMALLDNRTLINVDNIKDLLNHKTRYDTLITELLDQKVKSR